MCFQGSSSFADWIHLRVFTAVQPEQPDCENKSREETSVGLWLILKKNYPDKPRLPDFITVSHTFSTSMTSILPFTTTA